MPLLEVRNLTVAYNGQPVIENISFSADEGDIFGIIGPNGAGKTTLLRALLNQVAYQGEVIWQADARIGYVPQRFELDRTLPLTGQEFLLLRHGAPFWLPRERDRQEIFEALSHVGARQAAHRRLGELSGGEFQRLLIAAALLGRPNVLLCDEPTAHIDLAGEETVYNLIWHLAREYRLTVFFISHDFTMLYTHANRVLCLNRTLLCSGPPQDVLTPQQLRDLYGMQSRYYGHRHQAGQRQAGRAG